VVTGAAPPRVVVARAPARLDFGGGWTDVPPYCDAEGGTVCNLAIARYATVRLSAASDPEPAPLAAPGRRGADCPPRRGPRSAAPGCSAAARGVGERLPGGRGARAVERHGVALAAALAAWGGAGAPPNASGADDAARRDALAEWSRAVEVEDAGIAGGRQDHYAAARGGALRLDFGRAAGGAPCRRRRSR
jgi:D-glycero-alpha-D-manno-heptose-7-phosphate kinase